jgi:CRP/FNR family transcriptional regulator, cyclic AMP receptor protein
MKSAQLPDALALTLARSDLFQSASASAIEAICAAMVERNWRTGELLFAAGDPSDGFYVVADGSIRLGLATSDGGELTLRDVGAGEIFGEIGALDGGPRSASARVVSATARTAFLPRGRFDEVLARNSDLLLDITRKLCQRLRETTEQLEGIALYSLRRRLARFILSHGRARGHDRIPGKRSVSIPLSQAALATVLGASRPKINGALQELEREGVIERRGALFLYDSRKLTAEAEGLSNGAA